jgi:hypothetical protein
VKPSWSVLVGVMLVLSTLGCATCPSPHDDTYAAYGSSQPRVDSTYGRVGSRFAPAGGAPESTLGVAPEPGLELIDGSREPDPVPAVDYDAP